MQYDLLSLQSIGQRWYGLSFAEVQLNQDLYRLMIYLISLIDTYEAAYDNGRLAKLGYSELITFFEALVATATTRLLEMGHTHWVSITLNESYWRSTTLNDYFWAWWLASKSR